MSSNNAKVYHCLKIYSVHIYYFDDIKAVYIISSSNDVQGGCVSEITKIQCLLYMGFSVNFFRMIMCSFPISLNCLYHFPVAAK